MIIKSSFKPMTKKFIIVVVVVVAVTIIINLAVIVVVVVTIHQSIHPLYSDRR